MLWLWDETRSDIQVNLVIHIFHKGLSIIEEGKVNGTELSLESKKLGGMSFVRDPAVTRVKD